MFASRVRVCRRLRLAEPLSGRKRKACRRSVELGRAISRRNLSFGLSSGEGRRARFELPGNSWPNLGR